MLKILLFAVILLALPQPARADYPTRPKLILTIVIDQFRADYLTRFKPRFLPASGKEGSVGGFRYLMDDGAYFPFGEYGILECMTGPGHATILTGAYPYQMGIPINTWADAETGQPQYCVGDPASPLVGAADAKKAARGASPRFLLASTVGDELKSSGLPSRVVTLALKDRAAVLLGGHRADLAFWFDTASFRWVSSRYYLRDGKLPDWLTKLGDESAALKGQPQTWELHEKGSGLSETSRSSPYTGIGAGFPHHTDGKNPELALMFPLSTDLTETAAERAFDALKLGRGPAPDLLALSFSAHDLLGHHFGPNSREMEEETVLEDRAIAKLLNHIRKAMPGGLRDVLIAFTADHGIAPYPPMARDWGFDAGVIDNDAIMAAVNARLNDRFGKPDHDRPWVLASWEQNIWLNHEAINDKQIDPDKLFAEIRGALSGTPGILRVFTRQDYERRRLPPGLWEKQIENTYIPGRSGDVMLILQPYYAQKDETAEINHVTGYAYDRTVPIAISWKSGSAGHGVRPGTYASRAAVVDIAPTLSYLSGVLPPSMSEGRVLSEIVVGSPSP